MISRKFGVICTGKFSKTTKLHEPVRQVQFVVFENFQVFITPNCTRNHVVTSWQFTWKKEKHHRKSSRETKFWKRARVCARYICNFYTCYNFVLVLQLCTRVTTLHSCCTRMHSCLANQKRVIFSCTLLVKKNARWKGHLLIVPV